MRTSSLSPDFASAESALSGYATAMKAINNYGAGLGEADFGPFEIGGNQYDLLANFPGLKANLCLAQQRVNTFRQQDYLLMTLVALGNFQSTFEKATNSILSAIQVGQPIAGFLNSLVVELESQEQGARQTSAGIAAFSNELTTDKANLGGSESSISEAIQSIERWVASASESVLAGPGGAGIAETIASVGKQITEALGGVLSSLEVLVPESEAAGAGAAALLVMWRTLRGKYQDLIDELTKAGTDPGILAPGDVQAAQLAWRELAAYAVSLI